MKDCDNVMAKTKMATYGTSGWPKMAFSSPQMVKIVNMYKSFCVSVCICFELC